MIPPVDKTFEIDNLPNRLTIFRLILVPVIAFCLYYVENGAEFTLGIDSQTLGWIAAWIFVIASVTDFFDGYFARKLKLSTVLGSFLDPIADKFLVVTSLIMLQGLGRIHSFIVVILICRELYITSLRLLAQNQGLVVPVTKLGKWKTAVQMLGIPPLMIYSKWWVFDFPLLGTICLYIASFLSLLSAFRYSLKLLHQFQIKIKKNMKAKKYSKKLFKMKNKKPKSEHDK